MFRNPTGTIRRNLRTNAIVPVSFMSLTATAAFAVTAIAAFADTIPSGIAVYPGTGNAKPRTAEFGVVGVTMQVRCAETQKVAEAKIADARAKLLPELRRVAPDDKETDGHTRYAVSAHSYQPAEPIEYRFTKDQGRIPSKYVNKCTGQTLTPEESVKVPEAWSASQVFELRSSDFTKLESFREFTVHNFGAAKPDKNEVSVLPSALDFRLTRATLTEMSIERYQRAAEQALGVGMTENGKPKSLLSADIDALHLQGAYVVGISDTPPRQTIGFEPGAQAPQMAPAGMSKAALSDAASRDVPISGTVRAYEPGEIPKVEIPAVTKYFMIHITSKNLVDIHNGDKAGSRK